MGHSTLDIPTALLMPAAKDDFLDWIRSLPVTATVKRYLLATWTRKTNTRLYYDDYLAALGTTNIGFHHAP